MNTTESVDSLYSSEARGKALVTAGNRFVSSTRFKSTVLDVRPLDVCRVLKEANSVIDVALEFDERHAKSRLLEVEADPDKPVPNPYCVENLESLKTVVRTVLSSALEELRLSMPPDWEGSQLQVSQFTAAEAALLKRIDEEYPRRHVDFYNQARSRRNSGKNPSVGASGAVPTPRRNRSTRRGQPIESPQSKRVLLVAALLTHHNYNSNGDLKTEPITVSGLARKVGAGKPTASRLFKRIFGDYRQYVKACVSKDYSFLSNIFEKLAGDKPMRGIGRQKPFQDMRSTVSRTEEEHDENLSEAQSLQKKDVVHHLI